VPDAVGRVLGWHRYAADAAGETVHAAAAAALGFPVIVWRLLYGGTRDR
jgi:hypothetical protein